MGSSCVVVAIPSEDDMVWRYSTEKVPHITLLYLAPPKDADEAERIFGYLEHAAKIELSPFGLSVDRRGTLGEKEADVLFFEQDRWSYIKELRRFRSDLLKDETVIRAHEAVDQFEEWTPHLTMGYPENPAKPDDRDYPGFHYVQFDRIAIWFDDYEGPEIRLEDKFSMSETNVMAHAGQAGASFLKHYGTPGMKWGVRNDRGHEGERAKTKKIEKLDAKFEKEVTAAGNGRVTMEFRNAAISRINSRVSALNDSDKYRGKDLDIASKLRDDYDKDMAELMQRSFEDATHEIYGSNASGTKRGVYNRETDKIDIVDKGLKHAETVKVPDVTFELTRNDSGHVTSVKMVEKKAVVKHMQAVENFFAHYGVKGMRWGVTTVDKSSSPTTLRDPKRILKPKDVTVTQKKAGTYVTAKGGQRQKATNDAVKAQAGRQKAKKSTTDSLSNAELKALVERMQLEQQYHQLNKKTDRLNKPSLGRRFIGGLAGNQLVRRGAKKVIEKAVSD